MGRESKISWTHATFNPWRGCVEVSPACDHCYARELAKRNPAMLGTWGDNGTRVVAAEKYWKDPTEWNKQAAAEGFRERVFCASLADVFEDWDGPMVDSAGHRLYWSHSRQPHESIYHWISEPNCAGDESPVTMNDVRRRLFDLIDATPNLDWLLLTKRPENIDRMWPRIGSSAFGRWLHNVWLGTTVENQEMLELRLPYMAAVKPLAHVRFLSCEPLLGPLSFRIHRDGLESAALTAAGINWVIGGGESGPHARPSHPDWFRSLRDQCAEAGVPFHFKQWGEWHPEASANYATGKDTYAYGKVDGLSMLRNGDICLRCSREAPSDKAERVDEFALSQFAQFGMQKTGYQWMQRIGTKQSGRLLDKVLHDAFPVFEPVSNP